MTVVDYEAKFTKLAHFASTFIADEKKKCRLFQDGLCLKIKIKIKMHNYGSFVKLIMGTIRAEEIKKKFYSRR